MNWPDFHFPGAIYDIVLWTVVVLMLVVGFLGTFLPLLPGATLIFLGGLLYYFAMGMETSGLTWQGLDFMALLVGVSLSLDWVAGALGAKWFGSSKWGIAGTIAGAIVGIFFGLPGIIIGPVAGAFIFELFVAGKQVRAAGHSTLGAVVGGLAGVAGKVAISLGMITWFVVDVFFIH